MSDLWFPDAIRLDGPASKTGYNGATKTHPKVGVCLHTMGYESTPEWNDATTLHNALFSGREASWTFSICKFMNGSVLYQHYPLDAVCWAQGYQGNLWLIGIETEGIAPGKFTEAQYELLVKLLRWIKEAQGWPEWYGIGFKGFVLSENVLYDGGYLWEHNAVPGAPATNCAVFTHGQVDPERLLRDLREEEMQTTPFSVAGHTYVLTETGFLHVHDNAEQARLERMGYDFSKTQVLRSDDPVLDHCPVTYREIPGPMR